MHEKPLKLDFSEVENIKFTCLDQCGKCCFYQAPVLTTTEINRMLSHLETMSHEEFEQFAFDWLSYFGKLGEITKELLDEYIESLRWFWSPFQLEEVKEGVLVRSYTIHSMPSSGRCKLLNPIDMRCFVYPARPDTCRLYPFTQCRNAEGVIKIKLAMKNCPGIREGTFNLDKKEIEQIIREGPYKMGKDIASYEKFIADNDITRLPVNTRKSKIEKVEDVDQAILEFEKNWRDTYFFGKKDKKSRLIAKKRKKFIEPLAELGLIPKHPLLLMWNEKVAQPRKKNLKYHKL